jgi:hypothetical protein
VKFTLWPSLAGAYTREDVGVIFSLDNYVFWEFLTLFKTEKDLSPLAFEHGINIKNFKAISTIGNESFNFDTVNTSRKLHG